MYKFLRDVNFAAFVVNWSSKKFKSTRFYKTIVIHENKIAKNSRFGSSTKFTSLKICMYIGYNYTMYVRIYVEYNR